MQVKQLLSCLLIFLNSICTILFFLACVQCKFLYHIHNITFELWMAVD